MVSALSALGTVLLATADSRWVGRRSLTYAPRSVCNAVGRAALEVGVQFVAFQLFKHANTRCCLAFRAHVQSLQSR
jgi:hypothetical protein